MKFMYDIIDCLEEAHENDVPVSYKSLIRTISNCEDVINLRIGSINSYAINPDSSRFCVSCVKINVGKHEYADFLLWLAFTDKETCYIVQLFPVDRNMIGINKESKKQISTDTIHIEKEDMKVTGIIN